MSEFQVANWSEVLISDAISEIETGVSVNSENRRRGASEVGILKTSCVSRGRFFPEEHKAVLDVEVERAKTPLKARSILMSRMNTPNLVGEIGYVQHEHPEIYLPDRLWMFSGKEGISDTLFLSHLLSSDAFRQKLSEIATGTSGSMKNIPQRSFLQIPIPLPPLPEQKKIAETLSGIDKVLTSLELHADKLRLARDEVVAAFFDEASKSSEFAEIRSFGEIVTGSTPPTNNPLNYGGAMPFISPGDIGDSAVVAETKATLSAAGAAISRVIPPSSVCVVCIGSTIGKVALTTTKSATNQQINALTPGAYDPFFMLAAISHMKNEIRSAASTHAVPIINKSRFGEISIPKPNIEKQRQFGSYISSSHKMLSQIMVEIQKYQHLKNAVASDLLSGRKRVSV